MNADQETDKVAPGTDWSEGVDTFQNRPRNSESAPVFPLSEISEIHIFELIGEATLVIGRFKITNMSLPNRFFDCFAARSQSVHQERKQQEISYKLHQLKSGQILILTKTILQPF